MAPLVVAVVCTAPAESELLPMICANIWKAAAPTGSEPWVYAGTSWPLHASRQHGSRGANRAVGC